MLYINVKRVMRLRGVDNHYKMLVDLGFAPSTARKFLRNEASRLELDQIEKLCLALKCTPNDLLEWQPSENQANAEGQGLIKLKRNKEEDLPSLFGSLPMEKFEQIKDILQDLNSKQLNETL